MVTNDLNQTNTRINNARGELAQVIDSQNQVTDYRYDPFGNLVAVEDAHFNLTSNSYDTRGRKIAMTDPDMGAWSYQYNALGELVSQTDAKNQTVTMQYDLLGRLISRTEPEGTATWTYDTATYGIGKLHTVSGAEGDTQTLTYDSLGRPVNTYTAIGTDHFSISQSYDANGKVDVLTYPASVHYPQGLEVRNNYNARGYLAAVENVSNLLVYWQADTLNAAGQLIQATLGNGLRTQWGYTPQTGLLQALGSSTPLGTNDIQDLGFTFDTLGNLTQRQDITQSLSETFVYDSLNRLTSSTLNDGATQTAKQYTYDALGNILSKTGIGAYVYGENGAGVHAVTTAGGQSLSYDANGNMTSSWNFTQSQARAIAWTSYNQPSQIVQGATTTITLSYGADRQLFKQVAQTASGGSTRFYIDNLYERDTAGSLTTHIHYIKAGGEIVALYKSKSNLVEETRYLHKDHLGSITVITDEAGAVSEELSYDPHGKRRNIDWSDALAQLQSFETKRSFTGHLYLDDVGLIHMGGRYYDPELGRFLSADPFIQEPANAQSLNRYSYVLNNPLSYTDPSGFFFSKIFKAIGKAIKAVMNFIKDNIRTIFAIALMAIPGGHIIGSMVLGFAAGMVASGGDLRAGIIGAITAGAFHQIGHSPGFRNFARSFGAVGEKVVRTVAHGVVGGLSQVARGGKFLAGFLSAGFNQGLERFGFYNAVGVTVPAEGDYAGYVKNAVVAAAVGGTASVLGGDKFKNGAITGAFSRMFNDTVIAHSENNVFPGDHYYKHISNISCAENIDPGCTFTNLVNKVNTVGAYYNQSSPLDPNGGWQYIEMDSVIKYDIFTKDPIYSLPTSSGVINRTADNHLLDPGLVQRDVINMGGRLYIQTIGAGSGWLGGPNIDNANSLWESVNNKVFNNLQ